MGFYEDRILPHCTDWVMSAERLSLLRNKYLEGVAGRVLEVGFGTGLNLPHYTQQVTHLYALDPSLLSRRLAAQRIQDAPFPIEFVELEGNRIALPDNSVDAVVSTWTVCTIPDPVFALKEIRRVLKPEGKYHFLEHGLSPERRIARLQNLWNPLQKILGGGCHVNRKIDQLVLDAGLRTIDYETFYMDGPKILSYMYRGVAVPLH